MIIKSLARKRPGFRQLIGYIGRGGGDGFSRNLYGVEQSREVEDAFEKNYALLPKRRNGNALYHEVIVLPPQPGLSRAKQEVILRDLAQRYCELRAPDNLAWGRIHLDTDNSHIHLMISANAAQSKTRTRLSKARFAEVQIEMEREARARFPDLQDRQVYDRSAKGRRKSLPVRQDAMERNNPKMTRKAFIRSQIDYWLPRCQTADDLHRHLGGINLELYQRGKHYGVRDTVSSGRHRLSTLGVEDAVKMCLREWERTERVQKQIAPNRLLPVQHPIVDQNKKDSNAMSMEEFYANRLNEFIPRCRSEDDLHSVLARLDLTLVSFGPPLSVRDFGTGKRYSLSRIGVDGLIKGKLQEWRREADKAEKATQADDPRATELSLARRNAQRDQAERILGDFDGER